MEDIANIGNILITVFDEMVCILLFHTYEYYSMVWQIISEIVMIVAGNKEKNQSRFGSDFQNQRVKALSCAMRGVCVLTENIRHHVIPHGKGLRSLVEQLN